MKSFKVSNFRLFDNTGTTIKFKPVTILTGSNSSGKSSYVKALVAFKDYIDSVRNEYKRDGSLNPVLHKMDFTRPELKLKGFSSVKNRKAQEDENMSFTLSMVPKMFPYGTVDVTYSFNSSIDGSMDLGDLVSISITQGDKEMVHIGVSGSGGLAVESMNLNGCLMEDFVNFCRFVLLPNKIFESAREMNNLGYSSEYCDEHGRLSIESVLRTERGKRISKLQNRGDTISGLFANVNIIDRLDDHKVLFDNDLLIGLESIVENDLIFYFPVLDNFKGKSKLESLEFLDDLDLWSSSIQAIDDRHWKFMCDMKNAVRNDYEKSDYESFIDYFRSLEDYTLENYNKSAISIRTMGKSYNFIENSIMYGIGNQFDNYGFSGRRDCLFNDAYAFLSSWQWAEEENADTAWKSENPDPDHIKSLWQKNSPFFIRSISRDYEPDFSSRHVIYEAYKDYIAHFLTECLIPVSLERLLYNNTSFTSVQRLHTFEENSQFVQNIKRYLANKESIKRMPLYGDDSLNSTDSFLNKWLGKEGLDICKSLLIKVDEEGLGFQIFVVHEDDTIESLADLGHGITQIVSILLQIESIILENRVDYRKTETFEYSKRSLPTAILAIEEPEVSLHPCFQSKLADIFMDAATNYGTEIHFIIETHSEYMIRKTQAIVAGMTEEEFKKEPFAVYYFTPTGESYELEYKESGRFERPFGPGFLDESARSNYQVLKKEEQMRKDSVSK